jgi:1-acyl-sn-glycerol-3-phosphate acyltransferase
MSARLASSMHAAGSQRFYDAHRAPVRLLFTLLLHVKASGLERVPQNGGLLLVCNHLTDLDPLLLGVLIPRQLHFMAKEELLRVPLLGGWLRRCGVFPIRRGEVDRAALKYAEDLLRAGRVVMIFPEGHRSTTAQLQEARAGAVMLASRTGCPILPLAIAGTEQLSLRGDGGWSRLLRLRRPLVQVWAGELITIGARSRGAERKEAADKLMRQIVSLLPERYHGVYADREP